MKAHYDIVMLVLNDVVHDGRVRREASALAAGGWRVLMIGTQRSDGDQPDCEHLQGFDLCRVRYARFGAQLWRPWRWFRHGLQAIQIILALRTVQTRAYHAHDLPALILLFIVRSLFGQNRRLIYDSHELYLFMGTYESRLVKIWHCITRPLFMRLEQYLAHKADAVITVSEPMARVLALWYNLPRPVAVHNGIDPVEHTASSVLRTMRGENRRCIIHTGTISNRERCLTELVEALALLPDDISLIFLGEGESEQAVITLAERLNCQNRLRIIPPVAPELVAATIQQADISVSLSRPTTYNVRVTLPNKLFEAVAAGLPIVATDTFALRRIMQHYDLGILCAPDNPQSIAVAIQNALHPEAQQYYRANVRTAQAMLNWQTESEKLCTLYRTLM